MNKAVFLLALCLLAAVYLKMLWLAAGILVLVFLFALLGGESPSPTKSRSESKETEILHPVVYEDVGGPSLYPERTQITRITGAQAHRGPIGRIGYGLSIIPMGLAKGIKKILGDED